MVLTNRTTFLVGTPERASTQPFGRLRDGRQKPAIQVSAKRGIVSRLISKGKEREDRMVQTRAEGHQRSRSSLGGIRPSLAIQYTGAPHPLMVQRHGLTFSPLESPSLRVRLHA